MRIKCHHCEKKAVIKTTAPITNTFTTFYLICPACGSKWVMNLEVSHEIPNRTHADHLANIIQQLPPDQKQSLISHIQK